MHTQTLKRFVRLILGISSLALTCKAQEPATISVCDVFKDPERWAGKLIAVRGEVYINPEAVVVQERRCQYAPVAGSKKLPIAVSLYGARHTDPIMAKLYPGSVEFMTGLSGLLIKEYWRQMMEPPFRVSATFIGTLRTHCPKCESYGGFPAEMVYIAVRDVTLTGLQGASPKVPSSPNSY